jgi:predicted RNA-binding protein with PUA-like domain
MNYWLLKSDPDDYGFEELEKDGQTTWQGVRNNQALMFLREMRAGDHALIYHTGKEKQIVGVAEVVRGPYPDPEQVQSRLSVIDVKAAQRLKRPIPLTKIKEDEAFKTLHLVRMPRLSVMPVPAAAYRRLLKLGECA